MEIEGEAEFIENGKPFHVALNRAGIPYAIKEAGPVAHYAPHRLLTCHALGTYGTPNVRNWSGCVWDRRAGKYLEFQCRDEAIKWLMQSPPTDWAEHERRKEEERLLLESQEAK